MANFWAFYPPGSGGGSNASVGPNGSTIPGDSTLVGGENPSGNLQPLQTDAQGNLLVSINADPSAPQSVNLTEVGGAAISEGQKTSANSFPVVIASDQTPLSDLFPSTQNVTVQDTASSTATGYNGQTLITGTPTSGSSASYSVNGIEAIAVQVSGTWTGTLEFEVSIDSGTTWVAHGVHQFGSAVFTSTVTGNYIASLNMAGKTNFRARATAAITGTATIRVVESANPSTIYVANGVKIVDSTIASSPPSNTIKAASTAAVATDTALVVAVSPNNTPVLPSGAATAANQTNVQSAPGTPQTTAITIQGNSSGVAVPVNDQAVGDTVVTGQSAQTATVNNILTTTSGSAATQTTGFRSMSVQVNSTGTAGTYIFEGSNDNSNFVSLPVYNQLVITGTPITGAVTASATNIVYIFPVTTEYVRLRIASTITGGSIQAFSRMSPIAWYPPVIQVAQTTAANLATTATISSGTVTTVSTVTNANAALPGLITDTSSAAITTTTTSGPYTPTYGSSYLVVIPVTAVSGTTPSMVVQVQESQDSGTTFNTVYTFPAITATGTYASPALVLKGNRIQYVQTITGTTPSFTRSNTRYQLSQQNIINPAGGILSDASGTTSATPSTSTQALAANGYRRYLLIQNTSSSNTLWVNFTTAANASEPSIELVPYGSLVMETGFCSSEAVNVLCTVASSPYTVKWA